MSKKYKKIYEMSENELYEFVKEQLPVKKKRKG